MQFVLLEGHVPVNPYTNFGFNLYELITKDVIMIASDFLFDKSDELWVFGAVDFEVEKAIERANKKDMPIKYFKVGQTARGIKPIFKDEVVYDSQSNTK